MADKQNYPMNCSAPANTNNTNEQPVSNLLNTNSSPPRPREQKSTTTKQDESPSPVLTKHVVVEKMDPAYVLKSNFCFKVESLKPVFKEETQPGEETSIVSKYCTLTRIVNLQEELVVNIQ